MQDALCHQQAPLCAFGSPPCCIQITSIIPSMGPSVQAEMQHVSAKHAYVCAVSGRHGSIASCASLPNLHGLPQHQPGLPPLSRQGSDAHSSSLSAQMDVSQSQTAAASQATAMPEARLAVRPARAASWGPQGSARNTRVRTTPAVCPCVSLPLSVRLSVFLPAYLTACLPLSVGLSLCLPACLLACFCLYICLCVSVSVCLSACLL